MRKTFLIIFIILIIGFIAFTKHEPKVIFFGDSLVEGVGAAEDHDLPALVSENSGLKVENFGRSGDTTGEALARLETVIAEDPDIVIVLLGGNDILRKIPPQETARDLESIRSRLESSGAQVIMLDIYEMLDGFYGESRYMADPLHPNDAGYEIMAQRVLKYLCLAATCSSNVRE